jgi:hypothetical protein
MQKFSDPIQHCSTTVGRSLLEWYCGIEDYCCFLGAYRALLPAEWRRENVRIRQLLAHEEYPRITPEERKPRLLDDLWPQLYALVPVLGDVLATVPLLKTLEGSERFKVAAHLTAELRQFMRDFRGFLKSPHVVEIFLPASSPQLFSCHNHVDCCPSPPFNPDLFHFPPAGIFKVILQCLETYIRASLYPLLRMELEFDDVILELEDEGAAFYSVEVCRTFAGLEHQYSNNPEVIVPCFSPLVIAGLSCPPHLRRWVWCKLAHSEQIGLRFDSIKQNLAVLWDMPEIPTDGSSPFQANSSYGRRFSCDDIEFGVNTGSIKSEDTSFGDGTWKSLTQLRGLFGFKNEE